jgi:hypothetical protein
MDREQSFPIVADLFKPVEDYFGEVGRRGVLGGIVSRRRGVEAEYIPVNDDGVGVA